MKYSNQFHLSLVFMVVACGQQENPVISAVDTSSKGEPAAEQSLGLGNSGSTNVGNLYYASGPNVARQGEDQALTSYVRYRRGNGVECSGVLAYEPSSSAEPAGLVDVYLYTALHCFEESDPFGRPKGIAGTISQAYRYKRAAAQVSGSAVSATASTSASGSKLTYVGSVAPELANMDQLQTISVSETTTLVSSGVSVMTNNGHRSDVARVWQMRAPIEEVKKKVLPICASKPSEGSRVQTFGFGSDVDYRLSYNTSVTTSLGSSTSFGVTAQVGAAVFQAKQVGMALNPFINEPSRALAERLGILFASPTQLGISPYIMRMGGTSSQPGESGSPVLSVEIKTGEGELKCPVGRTLCLPNEKVLTKFSEDQRNHLLTLPSNITSWNCVAGLLSREVAQRPAGSNTLEWDTYFSPFLNFNERSWSTANVAPHVVSSRTYSTLAGQSVTTNPLGDSVTTNGGNPSGSQTLTSCFGTLCPSNGASSGASASVGGPIGAAPAPSTTPVVKTISSRLTNINAETFFGSAVYKSATPKEIVIASNGSVVSTSTSTPALLAPAGLGGTLKITNNGKIIGKGGTAGSKGGDALVVQSPLTLVNSGMIAGGGGGGGVGGSGGAGGTGGSGKYLNRTYFGGTGGTGGAGGSGGKGEDESAAAAGVSGKAGTSGRTASKAGAGGTGGTGGAGGSGGALGQPGSNGQQGGIGGRGGNGTLSIGSAGSAGTAGSAGGRAGFAINGSALLEGQKLIGGSCQTLSPTYGDLRGAKNALVNSTDGNAYGCK
jgi:hypothetical protein